MYSVGVNAVLYEMVVGIGDELRLALSADRALTASDTVLIACGFLDNFPVAVLMRSGTDGNGFLRSAVLTCVENRSGSRTRCTL